MPNRPVPGGPPRPHTAKKRRRGRLIAILASALTLVLIVSLGLVLRPFGGSDPDSNSDGAAVSHDPRYLWEKPRTVKSGENIEFKVNYDYEAECAKAKGTGGTTSPCTRAQGSGRIVKLFADSALTVRVNVLFQSQGTRGRNFTIHPSSGTSQQIHKTAYGEPDWSLHAEYYLVRYLDKDGQKLAKPSVTKIIPERTMEPPRVSFATTSDGDLTLSWSKVEGAKSYVIVFTKEDKDGDGRTLRIIDETKDNSWTSYSTESGAGSHAYVQNDRLRIFSGTSAEDVESGDQREAGQWTGYDIGVLAKNGNEISGYRSYDAARILSVLPYSSANSRNDQARKDALKGAINALTPEQLPTTYFFTALDGSTRATVARLDASTFTAVAPGRYRVELLGAGTRLGDFHPVQTDLSPQAFADQYNQIALAAAAQTGGEGSVPVQTVQDATAGGEKTVPKVPYPVYGSNPMTKAIGAHLIAQSEWIDLEDFVDQPGAPDPADAAQEAMSQNPYAASVKSYGIGPRGLIRVEYLQAPSQTETRQKQLKDKSDAVLKEIIKPDMDDAAKVTAINNWLVQHAEYDYEALNAKKLWESQGTAGATANRLKYLYSGQADGVLLQGKGVCASYSYAFTLLANAAGVESVYVTGDVVNGGRHAWNKSKVNGTWKATDVTWNDIPAGNRYLMISDKDFTDDAQRTEDEDWMIDSIIDRYAAP